ncbi:MAG: thioesterase family protein [Bacteroidales bacterium]
MISYDYTVRVAYSETDKMAVVHHSNYARYLENARWELFRSIGIPYTEMEERGYMCPVILLNIKYVQVAKYDQQLVVHTVLKKTKAARMYFYYTIYNQSDEIVAEADVQIACVRSDSWKPCVFPDFIREKIT